MSRYALSLLVGLPLFLSTGCVVSQKKHDALAAELAASRADLEGQVADRDQRISTLEEELSTARTELAAVQAAYEALETEREEQVSALRSEKAELVKDRSRLRASVEEVEAALAELDRRKRQAEARVAAYQDMLSRFQSLIDAGRLQVKIADGRMIVELATDILFASGKAELSEDGAAALAEVGAVLAEIPGKTYQVEGHTDDVPIQTTRYPSNWELGSARAVTVLKTLVDSGIDPVRLSAATFSEYRPVASNEDEAGQSANRRIEIVVVPDLSQLPGFDELEALDE